MIVKDLIQTYAELQSEKYIYVSDKFPKFKNPIRWFYIPTCFRLKDTTCVVIN